MRVAGQGCDVDSITIALSLMAAPYAPFSILLDQRKSKCGCASRVSALISRPDIIELLEETEGLTQANNGLTLVIAFIPTSVRKSPAPCGPLESSLPKGVSPCRISTQALSSRLRIAKRNLGFGGGPAYLQLEPRPNCELSTGCLLGPVRRS